MTNRRFGTALALVWGLAAWPAMAACPNQSATLTIPLAGTATVQPVDAVSCAALDPTKFTVGAVAAGVIANPTTLSATTSPSLTVDSAGLHFAAGAASFAAAYSLSFTYSPNAKTFQMTATVGGTATPVGTTTNP